MDFKSKRIKRSILYALIMISFLLSACSNGSKTVEISKDSKGYNLSGFIDKDEEQILSGLYKAGADPQFHTETTVLGTNVKIQYYVMLETKRGLEFEVSLLFADYPDAKKYIMSGYEEKLYLDHWPEEEEQKALQAIFDDMIAQYGEPCQKQGLFDGNTLFDKYKISRHGDWEDGLISFTIDYDLETKETLIWIYNFNSQFYNDHYEEQHGMERPFYKYYEQE